MAPLYDYECAVCGVFEHFKKLDDPELELCPKCELNKVKKLLSPVPAHFTGSGFFQTDYKNKESKKNAKKD